MVFFMGMRPQLSILVALTALSGFLPGSLATASVPHETFVAEVIPTQDQIDAWSVLPGTRTYLIQTRDPGSYDLGILKTIRGCDRLEIEDSMYPTPDTVDAWKILASRGAEFIALGAGVPLPEEIDRLNAIGFSSCLIVLDYFPGVEESQRLNGLQCLKSITFAGNRYPKYEEKPGLAALPSGVPWLIATDYWPYYSHMDLFNMLPQHLKLRVSDMYPPDDEWDYLLHIQRLDQIEVQSDYEPNSSDVWKKFGATPVSWLTHDSVPTAAAIAAFASSAPVPGARKLVIDQDRSFNDSEKAALENATIPIEWIHLAPESFMRSRSR